MLNLQFGISNSNTQKAFNLLDLTGAYNATTNPGGFGAPNPTVGNIASASFAISSTAINIVLDVYPTLPTTNTALQYPITNADLGLAADANIPSDIYAGVYSCIDNGDNLYTDAHYFFYDANFLCCLAEFTSKLTANCGCSDAVQDALALTIIEISALIKATHEAVSPSCNQIEKARELVNQLNKLCVNCNCGCS